MRAIKQFQQKIKSHGFFLSGWFCIVCVARKFYEPLIHPILHSWSQAGEDRLLDRLMKNKQHGCYVDIGAHDPVHLSNTKRFYDRGWSGINIEPNPEWQKKFLKQRPRDINLAIGIGASNREMIYYEMKESALSSFDEQQVRLTQELGGSVNREYQISVRTLKNIFEEHVKDSPIDFLSIDIEGLEYEALESNNWERWRPRFICIEAVSNENISQEPVLHERDMYFQTIDYTRRAVTRNYGRVLNAIYEDTRISQDYAMA